MPNRFHHPFGGPPPPHPPVIFYPDDYYDDFDPGYLPPPFDRHPRFHPPSPPRLMVLPRARPLPPPHHRHRFSPPPHRPHHHPAPPGPPHHPQFPHHGFVPPRPGARIEGVGFEHLRFEGGIPREVRMAMGGGGHGPWPDVDERRGGGHRRRHEENRWNGHEEEDDDHEGRVVSGWGWERVRMRGGGCDSDEAERGSEASSSRSESGNSGGSGSAKSEKRKGRRRGRKGRNKARSMTVGELERILEEEDAGYRDATLWEEWAQGGTPKKEHGDDEAGKGGASGKKRSDE